MILTQFNNLSLVAKYYLVNFALALAVLLSVVLMFFVQFKVDNLQDRLSKSKQEIVALEDEIRVLEVEWVYLTRPQRLKMLVNKYLQNNQYVVASQIKDIPTLMEFYFARMRGKEDVAME